MAGFRGAGLGAVLGLLASLPTSAQQIDLYGVTQATFEWSAASGPVQGYYVIVARNGGTPALQGVAQNTRATVDSTYGDRVTVQVAAFDAGGVAGPVSPASSAIVFNPPPGDTDPPPPADPDPDPDPGDGPDAPDDGAPGDGVATRTRFDYTGDGRSDLLLRDPKSGELVLWEMQDATVMRRASLAHLPYPWGLEESGDYDGDGTADLLWRNADTGQLIVWLIRAGAVASGAGLDVGTPLTRDWTIAGRGDFNGDGRDDLALARPQLGAIDLLLMNGSTVASKLSRNAPDTRSRVVAAPDADGDGVAELVWENLDSHALSIEWISTPGRTVPLVSQAGEWRVLGVGDLDADGDEDLLVHQSTTRKVQALLLDGARAPQEGWIAKTGSRSWSYRGLGDFDGNGESDPFWHDSHGVVEVWFSSEGGVFSSMLAENTAGDRVVGDQGD